MSKIIGIDLGTTNSCVAVMGGRRSSCNSQCRGSKDNGKRSSVYKDGREISWSGGEAPGRNQSRQDNFFYQETYGNRL